MVQRLLCYFFVLICQKVLCSSDFPCLTWEVNQERLKFTCRVSGFTFPVSLFDSQGQLYANCIFPDDTYECTSIVENEMLVVDFARKTIVYTTAEINENMNGVWICLQDEHELTTNVSLSEGIISSTEIIISGTLISSTRHTSTHVLRCFSCREPDGNNAEFLVNGRSEDSITYNRDKGTCAHHSGKCNPDKCSCDANMFMRAFQVELKNNRILYTCDMLFTDSFTNAKFSILASVVFNGKGFHKENASTSIIRAADNIWKEKITSDVQIELDTEFDVSRVTQVTESSNTITEENTDGIPTIYVIAIVIAFGFCNIFSFCVIMIYLHFKRKNKKFEVSRATQVTESYLDIIGENTGKKEITKCKEDTEDWELEPLIGKKEITKCKEDTEDWELEPLIESRTVPTKETTVSTKETTVSTKETIVSTEAKKEITKCKEDTEDWELEPLIESRTVSTKETTVSTKETTVSTEDMAMCQQNIPRNITHQLWENQTAIILATMFNIEQNILKFNKQVLELKRIRGIPLKDRKQTKMD